MLPVHRFCVCCCSPNAFNWLPPQLKFLSPASMIEAFMYQTQMAVCSMVRRLSKFAGSRKPPPLLLARPAVLGWAGLGVALLSHYPQLPLTATQPSLCSF